MTSKHATFWLIVFGFNFASMISAAGRLRPFNTQRMFTSQWTSGLVRFVVALVILNVVPLASAIVVLGLLPGWFPTDAPTWRSLAMLMALSFTVYAWWRLLAAFAVKFADYVYRDDPAFRDLKASPLRELSEYSLWQHLGGAAVYVVVPVAIAWALCP